MFKEVFSYESGSRSISDVYCCNVCIVEIPDIIFLYDM